MLPDKSFKLTPRIHRFVWSFAPAAVVLSLAVAVALILGGPIAGAITGFLLGSALLLDIAILFLLLRLTTTRSALYLVLMGSGAYLASILLVLLLLSFFGPSQIM